MMLGNTTLTNLIDIAKISTCVTNSNDKDKSESIIKLTNDLSIKAIYYFTGVDYRLIGPDAWPNETINSIKFDLIRGNEQIYAIEIDDALKTKASPDSLCSTNMPLDIKWEWLKKLKPKKVDELKFLKVNLTREEESIINEKAKELKAIVEATVGEMLQPPSGRKR